MLGAVAPAGNGGNVRAASWASVPGNRTAPAAAPLPSATRRKPAWWSWPRTGWRTIPRLRAYLTGRDVASVTHLGSATKMCRIAEGAADLYARFGRTMEWDTAAPQAVLEAAGGTLTLLDGTALRYGKPGWANPGFCVQGA